jgi:hypothetical protein
MNRTVNHRPEAALPQKFGGKHGIKRPGIRFIGKAGLPGKRMIFQPIEQSESQPDPHLHMLGRMDMEINKRRNNYPRSQVLYRKRQKPSRYVPLQGEEFPILNDGDSIFSYPELTRCGRVDKMAFV